MIGFLLARLRRDEAALAAMGQGHRAPFKAAQGKRIAIVGNARALARTEHGAQIDAADIVVRINGAPLPDPKSHGSRTTWIGMSTPTPAATVTARAPELLMWMSPKRKRMPYAIARDPRFYLYPVAQWDDLHARLGTRPTTGMMLIDLALQTQAAQITLFGFDFFSSLSLSGGRTAESVPHDFNAERAMVEAMIAADPRLTLRT